MLEKTHQIHDFIIDFGIATEKEISLVTSINGYNEDSLNNIIYSRTAYHDMDQYIECELGDIEIFRRKLTLNI